MLDTIKNEAFWAWRKLKKFRKLQRPNYFPPNLQGMCAIGSAGLFKRLAYDLKIEQVKFKVGAYEGKDKWLYSHCWLTYNDYVIDITASQFDTIKNSFVVDLEENAFYLKRFNDRKYTFSSIEEVRNYFKEADWVYYQEPFIYGRKRLKFRV